ncbi:MAG: glycosyltransferase family 4 protein [Flavitalea sp.]
MVKILITAPSLNERENVSGISTIVRTIINNNKSANQFIHFRVGKKDGEKKGFKWVLNQLALIPRLTAAVISKKINIVYFNTDLTKPSIIRDYFLVTFAKYVLRRKIVLHIHGGHFLMTPPPEGSVFMKMIRGMFKCAQLCIVLSEIELKTIQKNYGVDGISLPNAIELKEILDSEKNFDEKLKLVFLGRVVNSKGIYQIAEALEALKDSYKDFDFHIYGSGPELDRFLNKLKSVDGLKYSYNGVVKGDEKWKALDQAHVFLLPSLYGEGMPIAMLEAMGRGCIPVVSDDASISTVVENNVNGYIVKKGDSQSLKETIQQLLFNRSLLPQMSKVARSTISQKFDIDNYLLKLNKYCSAL